MKIQWADACKTLGPVSAGNMIHITINAKSLPSFLIRHLRILVTKGKFWAFSVPLDRSPPTVSSILVGSGEAAEPHQQVEQG